MNNRFFKQAFTAATLSPYFIFKIACGLSLIYDACRNNKDDHGLQSVQFIFGLRSIIPSIDKIRENYNGYRHAVYLLEKYGYRKKWATLYMDSTCGKMQVKKACKELNALSAYKKHLSDAKIKWYHIDQKMSLRFIFPLEFVFLAAITFASHMNIRNREIAAELKYDASTERKSMRNIQ